MDAHAITLLVPPAVERVSYHDIREFLDRLSARAPGNRFRLPTEAEWEYACRAGATAPFSVGTALTPAQANIGDATTRGPKRRPDGTRWFVSAKRVGSARHAWQPVGVDRG